MQRIKEFIKRHKVTLMIIPSNKKSIKQLKFNTSIGFMVLMVLTLFNLSLFAATMVKTSQVKQLSSANVNLSENLLITKDRIDALSNINASRLEEVGQLKKTLSSSKTYMEERLEEMEKTSAYVNQIVTLFNKETNSSIKAPASRSFVRKKTDSPSNTTITEENYSDDDLFEEISSLIQNDDISIALSEQKNDYETLIQSMEERLSYLDRRPDYFPTQGKLSSGFGYRIDPITSRTSMHNGIDICNKSGTPIYAAGAGIVTFAKYTPSFGNTVIIDHGNGYETVYAHCSKFLVSAGDSVEKTQKIAEIGRTGRTTGTHLHFELRYQGAPINPFKLLNNQ